MKGLILVVLVSILTGCASAPPPAPFDWQKEFAGYWHSVNDSVRPVMVFRYPYMWEFVGDNPEEFGHSVSELKYIGTEGNKILFAERELSLGSFAGKQIEYKPDKPDEKPRGVTYFKFSIKQSVVGPQIFYQYCSDPHVTEDRFYHFPYQQQWAAYKKSGCSGYYSTGTYIRPDRRIEVEVEAPFSQIIAPDLLPPDN